MHTSEIVYAPIGAVDPNPFRQLGNYPYVERKLDTLAKSISDVGLWEGIIARQVGNRYQIAFGHHRLEAAHRHKLKVLPLIVRNDMTDEQMLQFMGRENMEDYNADFLCMLETWEAAITYLSASTQAKSPQPLVISRLLGWTRLRATEAGDQMTDTALACNAAHKLISGGYLSRDNLADLSVKAAYAIVESAHMRMNQLEKLAQKTERPKRELEAAKRHLGRAAKETARQVREGHVAQKDIRGRVAVTAYRHARQSGRPSPLFEQFGAELATTISRMLKGDSAETRLEEVRKALGDVTLDDDKRVIARLDFELGELGERTAIWRKRITPTDKKVTQLQIAKGGDEHE